MPGLVHFLRCVGRAAVRNGGKALAGLVPFGDVTFEIARDAFLEYRREPGETRLRLDSKPASGPLAGSETANAAALLAGPRRTYALGTLHGAVLPCHVMVHAANHGLRLVGWGQSVEAGERIVTVSPRYRDWYPPEVRNNQPASPASDLFLAARCLVYLAGGDPVA